MSNHLQEDRPTFSASDDARCTSKSYKENSRDSAGFINNGMDVDNDKTANFLKFLSVLTTRHKSRVLSFIDNNHLKYFFPHEKLKFIDFCLTPCSSSLRRLWYNSHVLFVKQIRPTSDKLAP